MTYEKLLEVINDLRNIISDKNNRNKKVLDFIHKINAENDEDSTIYSEYIDLLAYDMDYYDQYEDGYLKDDKLERMITETLSAWIFSLLESCITSNKL